MKICIDAGHGGKDSGAIGQRKSREKDFTLDIAKRCAVYTIKLGHSAVLTRSIDMFLGLTERANIANRANTDIFVSIHCNSAENSQANGIETFCYTGSSKGKEYANKVQSNLIKITGLTNRGVKEANFAVLKYTNMAGILVEVGFISNTKEELLLMSEEYRDKVAKAIVEAIVGKEVIVQNDNKFAITQNDSDISKYYTLEFQKFYNSVTKTKKPIGENSTYNEETKKAYETIGKLMRGEY